MQAGHRGPGTRVPVSGERPEEELAFAVVRRVLGVPVKRHDRDGRQGAVDARGIFGGLISEYERAG